ncbi:CREB-regulated transcription coactivator 1 isoform X4 [Onthophagus taurus]|uniref:CREB-regulated transcription coactivator 1 isoform X4 n=1 Tax=Onthophagus taurus TaxID=166361 RepID=UPI0039BE15BF
MTLKERLVAVVCAVQQVVIRIMANPRKFSEKIALHNHRQAEETARFEQIMREVSDATARPDEISLSHANMVSSHGHSHSHRESRARSQGGPIRRQDRKHDNSPYSTGLFLSPPPDTSWRRTNSDSALHQSAMQGMNNERNDSSGNRWLVQSMNGPDQHDGRPKSSCEVPRVPGINIYPSVHEPGTIQIPIGNNTGSLPDLTSVHFPSPIPTPLDQDGDQGSSPYSSSPVNTSPSTLSPTSLQHGVRHPAQFHFVNPPTSPHHQQNHLSVPNSRYHLHHNKNLPIDKNLTGIDGTDYTQLANMMYQQPQKVPASSPSPTLQQAGYRSNRPSPQSSPGLGGHHSAPCSPGAPSPLSNDYSIFSPAQLQQHFEQFSMMDTPANTVSYVDQTHVSQSQHQQPFTDVTVSAPIELTNDAGYYSTSPQFVYPATSPSLHTTPNTPTSIPDIILTDFSVPDDVSNNDLSKQLDLLEQETLRESLEPLDFDEIQKLSESGMNLIPDSVEDNFRLDRL